MNKTTIYARTAKGDRAASAATYELAGNFRDILKAIDGRSSVEVLRSAHGNLSAATLDEALAALAAEDYIRESASSTPASGLSRSQGGADQSGDESARRAQELRAKIRARRDGGERPTQDSEVRDPQRDEQARRDSEDLARREAAERARQEADAQVRRKAEEEARHKDEEARRKAEEEARRKAEQEARHKAEEEARHKAEEEARHKAEEEARHKAEEEARRKAEEEARRKAVDEAIRKAEEEIRRKAEEEARRKAEEEARRKAEEDAPRKAEEEARKKAEKEARKKAEEAAAEVAWKRTQVQARLLAEDQAWQEEQAQAMLEAAERAAEQQAKRAAEATATASASPKTPPTTGKLGSRTPPKRGKLIALALAALLVAGLVGLHLISFDGQIPRFQELVAVQIQEPVKISALRIALVPQPHLRLEGVSIGAGGQIKVPLIKATGEIGNLYKDKKIFKSVEFDSLVITEEGLGWILFSKLPTRDLVFESVDALNTTFESKNISLSGFDAKLVADDEGGWKTIAIQARDKTFSLELASKGESAKIEIAAQSFKIPFGSRLTLEDFGAKGTVSSTGLALTEFKGFAFGGTLSGNARLNWGANWSLAGELNAKQIDTARIVPDLIDGGRVAGDASYAMQAPQAAKLFAAPRLEGSLAIPRGTLLGTDVGSLVQGGEKRGDTKFTDLNASFLHEGGATQFRQVRFGQGGMSASGTVEVDADKAVRGRFAADLKLSTELRRANLTLSGTLKKIEWRRQ